MLRKTRLASVIALLAGGSITVAADPAEVVNKFSQNVSSSVVKTSEPLRDILPPTNKSGLKSEVIIRSAKKDNAVRKSVRVAQRPKSVLRLSEERVEKAEPTLPADVDESRVNAEAKRVESNIERKMQSLERSLKREEKRLEDRLQDLDEKRNKALGKGDVETLKRIERSEKQAVADYEKRIERLLATVSRSKPASVERAIGSRVSSPSPAPGSSVRRNQRPSVSSMLKKATPTWNRGKVSPNQRAGSAVPKPQPKPQKRRFKLWPFR